jgi:hypothetical protein
MRLVITLAALLAAATCRADSARLVRVWPQWHDGTWFESFHEFKSGEELKGKWIVIRTKEAQRTGVYFVTRVANIGGALAGSSFVIHVIRPDSTETHTFTIPATLPPGEQVFEIGLTGEDWVQGRTMPVAWEMELKGPDGTLLDRKASFLWEKPDQSVGK